MRVRLSNGHFFGMRKQIEKSFWIILGCCPLLEANFDFDKACPSTSSFEIVFLMSKHVVQILIRFKCFLLFEINNCVLYCEWTKKLADRVFCKKERERLFLSQTVSFYHYYINGNCVSPKYEGERTRPWRAVLWFFVTSCFYFENICLQNVKQL